MIEHVSPEEYKRLAAEAKRKARYYKRREPKPYDPAAAAVDVLMEYRPLPKTFRLRTGEERQLELGPEDRLSVVFADCLRILTRKSLLNAVWLHIPNEAKRHEFTAMILHRMGLIPGATDYVFGNSTGSGWIEFKVKPNTLRPNQQYFRDWCQSMNVPWACFTCRSDTYDDRRETVTAAITQLHEWGFIPDVRAAFEATKDKLQTPVYGA